jgi:Zn-dependent metalloprotease
MSLHQIGFSQQEIHDCSNYNSFRFVANNEQLNYYVNEIHPNGLIEFKLSKTQEINNFQTILSLMNIGSDNTFVMEREIPSVFDGNSKHLRYQQYYKNVLVEGGGYALTTTTDPCPKALSMSAFIASNINLSVQSPLTANEVKNIVASTLSISVEKIQTELLVTQNILHDCTYRLAWRANCSAAGSPVVWVDANNGTILKQVKRDVELNAPTINYGIVGLSDSYVAPYTKLESASGDIVAYDLTTQDCAAVDKSAFTPAKVPKTTANQWTSEAALSVFQTFYVTGEVANIYKSLGINFQKIKIGSGCNDNAHATRLIGDSSPGEPFIVIGIEGGVSAATFDVIGHELFHDYLRQLGMYNDYPAQGGIHEGLGDIFGTYVEYLFQKSKGGTYDWIIGDDASVSVRDIRTPKFKCYQTALGTSGDDHEIGAVLSYWFYLITEGDVSKNIPTVGIENAMKILLEAVGKLNNNSNMNEDLRNSTLMIAKDKFGPCSNELTAVGNAWNAILCGSKYIPYKDECNFMIKGDFTVCEELGKINLQIQPHDPTKHYRWYFPMGWGVNNASGNTLEIPQNAPSASLSVNSFPKYSYYPQFFEIEVYSVTDGITRRKTVKLIDCNHDDPVDPCSQAQLKSSNKNNPDFAHPTEDKVALSATKVKVFDIMGRLIFEGDNMDLPFSFANYPNQLLIYAYFDEQGRFIKTDKKLNLY